VQSDAAEEASLRAERVIVGDVEELDLEAELGGERFDAILFADVLEHLRDPAAVLRRVRPFVADGGAVVASIPNVAHASVRLSLLAGSFRYREQGLLDESHLRFFTREGVQDLFEGSGYLITDWLRPLRERELRPLRERVAELELQLGELDELRPLRGIAAELEALRRAHEVLQRRLVAERAAFAQGIAAVEEGVYGSRSWRYTAPLRGAIGLLRRLKP
jgi:SAM-dependent methyltransferase